MKLADFEGRWTVARQIENAVGPDAVFTGRVLFEPGEGGLVHREEGQITFDGQTAMTATRVYVWRAAAAGVDVFFDDGRYFHHIADGKNPSDRHDCVPDVYDVAYDFSGWPRWSSVWRVTGPRKDYVMRTRFERA